MPHGSSSSAVHMELQSQFRVKHTPVLAKWALIDIKLQAPARSILRRGIPGSHTYRVMDAGYVSQRTAQSASTCMYVMLCRYQGESDANAECLKSFVEGTAELFESFRKAFAQPDLPIAQVAITAESTKAPLATELRVLQASMRLSGVTTVVPDQLQLQSDGLHLTLESNIQVGELLADALAPRLR